MLLIHALAIGLLPSSAMAVASFLLVVLDSIEISKVLESWSQSLCAGLILAAVAVELFPILMQDRSSILSCPSFLTAVFLGFCTSLLFQYGIGHLVASFEEETENSSLTPKLDGDGSWKERTSPRSIELTAREQPTYQSISGTESPVSVENQEWEVDDVVISTELMSSPAHRAKIRDSALDIRGSVLNIDNMMSQIFSMGDKPALDTIREDITDEVDKEVHLLQYKIDRCRRLIEGSGAQQSVIFVPQITTPESWLNEKNKKRVHRNMRILKALASNVIEELESAVIPMPLLQEIHSNVLNMDSVLSKLHNKMEMASYRWKKRCAATAPIPAIGSVIPMSLMVPVTIDALVDGFLIGLASAISIKVGYILAMANAIEMGFLGIAVSIRIRKCTGSHILLRRIALITPPVVMLGATLLGMFSGYVSISYPFFFTMFVAFGIVALICLACNELMWESRQTLDGADSWRSAVVLFTGIFIIIAMDKAKIG